MNDFRINLRAEKGFVNFPRFVNQSVFDQPGHLIGDPRKTNLPGSPVNDHVPELVQTVLSADDFRKNGGIVLREICARQKEEEEARKENARGKPVNWLCFHSLTDGLI